MGYIGKKNGVPILIKGLKRLEYRGYDSVGISVIENKEISSIRTWEGKKIGPIY